MTQHRTCGCGRQAARDFMYALYANDSVDFQRRIIPQPGSAAMIGARTITQEQLDRLRRDINGLSLRQASPPSLDGMPLPAASGSLPVDGWKADVRFWLAMRK